MSEHKHLQSYVVEFAFKAAMIFYFFSVLFFPETIEQTNNFQAGFDAAVIIRLILLVVFSFVILALTGKFFKIISFSALIIGAIFKILLLISQDTFYFHHLLILSDSIMIIAIALYYLYRNQLREKSAARKKKVRKAMKRLDEVD